MPWLLVLASLASPTLGMVALEFPLEMNGVERVDFEVKGKSELNQQQRWKIFGFGQEISQNTNPVDVDEFR